MTIKILKKINLWSNMTDFSCEERKIYVKNDIIINVDEKYLEVLEDWGDYVKIGYI